METYDINKDTALVPYVIAQQLTDDVDKQNYLIKRAERHYKDSEVWRKQLNKSKNQIGFLKMFMEHWNKGYYKTISKFAK